MTSKAITEKRVHIQMLSRIHQDVSAAVSQVALHAFILHSSSKESFTTAWASMWRTSLTSLTVWLPTIAGFTTNTTLTTSDRCETGEIRSSKPNHFESSELLIMNRTMWKIEFFFEKAVKMKGREKTYHIENCMYFTMFASNNKKHIFFVFFSWYCYKFCYIKSVKTLWSTFLRCTFFIRRHQRKKK